jgi:alkanesulfonate monooxygenase SsuD/methylene tetrahydromethanopterin reductase-like flavin-dependent oxidoreductase (luciferase family)
MATERIRLGLLDSANTFDPGLVAKTMATIDHISGGRAILGLGGTGWSSSTRRTASTSAQVR